MFPQPQGVRLGWMRDSSGRMTRAEDAAPSSSSSSSSSPPELSLLDLPAHLLREVLGGEVLGAADVARAATTCATFRQVARSESLWRGLLAMKLGTQAEIVLPRALPDERCARLHSY